MTANSRYQPNRDPAVVQAFKDLVKVLDASTLDDLRRQAIGSYLRQAYDIYDGWARQPIVGRPAVLCPQCHTSLDRTESTDDVIACGHCGHHLATLKETL